jgi:hypothetical protein
MRSQAGNPTHPKAVAETVTNRTVASPEMAIAARQCKSHPAKRP